MPAKRQRSGPSGLRAPPPERTNGASPIPWPAAELFRQGPPRTYTGRELEHIAFPLGGVGAGSISLGGWGQLRDWEVRNRPDKGFAPGGCFFTLKLLVDEPARPRRKLVKVLQGPAEGNFCAGGHTARWEFGDGLPHFREASFTGSYPLARVELRDRDVPLDVALEAWSPFVPLEDRPSSLPGVVLTYRLRNQARGPVSGWVFGNLRNFTGRCDGPGGLGFDGAAFRPDRVNEALARDGLTGLLCRSEGLAEDDPLAGSLFLGTTRPEAAVWARWSDDFLWKFWEAISSDADFPPPTGRADIGTVGAPFALAPGESADMTFLLTWHFPTFEQYWKGPSEGGKRPRWRNYYATLWRDALDAAVELAANLERWGRATREFHDALHGSTLPAHVLDAVSSNLSILKTNTCLRLPDGTFYGWEGVSDKGGCCEGSCTHVWNYAQAQAFLFPSLQRSMREADYEFDMLDDGFLQFRMPLPPGTRADGSFFPCADGQMGVVVQTWREWLLGAGDDWLRRIWPKAKKALEFAWKYWDADRDGVMEGMQHNTLDIEFYGPNPMIGTLYLAALRAGERMARRLGDERSAAEYARLAEAGARKLQELLWNGEYFEQKVAPRAHEAWPEPYRSMAEKRGRDDRFPDWPRWQYGSACVSDQVIGCWLARVAGLGELLPAELVREALRAVFRHNFRADMTDHVCGWRPYALRDERALLVASWPRGGRPGYPPHYADEAWPGCEYQVASHMIYEGLVEEGLAIVRAVRERFTGGRRNPWDEFECGHHYARSLASYALLTALSGFSYSAPDALLGFAPRVCPEDFRAFFSSGTAWGVYAQRWKGGRGELSLRVSGGRLELAALDIELPAPAVRGGVRGGREPSPAEGHLAEAAVVRASSTGSGAPAPRLARDASDRETLRARLEPREAPGAKARLVLEPHVTLSAGDALSIRIVLRGASEDAS